MGSGVTLCFYLVIGIGVAVALWMGDEAPPNADRLFRTLTAPFFWPIYVPVLFARQPSQFSVVTIPLSTNERKLDGMASMIAQVERELDTALHSLDGWAEDVLAGEQHRIAELRTAWHQQANRIRELDQLLAQSSIGTPDPNDVRSETATKIPSGEAPAVGDTAPISPVTSTTQSDPGNQNHIRISEIEKSRNKNILKLKEVRHRMYDDLMATLAWVRELVTMIHLAKFTGAPASRALELVQQIAAAVEGLSEIQQYASQSAR